MDFINLNFGIWQMGVDAVGVFRVEVVGGNGGITGVDDIAQFGALTDFNKEELRCEGMFKLHLLRLKVELLLGNK